MEHICRRIYSPVLKKAIEDYLKKKGLEYSFSECDGRFEFVRDTGTEIGVLNYRIVVYQEGFMTYELLPFKEEVYTRKGRAELMNFIMRASFGTFGCWLMDIKDTGEIAYRTYCDWGDSAPDERWVEWMDRYFERLLEPMRNYLPGFDDIIHHGATCDAALKICIKNILLEGFSRTDWKRHKR